MQELLILLHPKNLTEAMQHSIAQYLMKGGKSLALFNDRDYVIPDDIKDIATATLAHRILLTPSARMREVEQETVIAEVLDAISIPGASARK